MFSEQTIQFNNKIYSLVSFKDLIDNPNFIIEIPQEQRLKDNDKIKEIVEYQLRYYEKHKQFNFINNLIFNKIEDNNIYYLTDGQHRYFSIKELHQKHHYNNQVMIEILLIKNKEEFKENYQVINKNTPLPDFPENIDKEMVEKVSLHFFEKYKIMFKTNRSNRPYINKNNFQNSISFLLDKLQSQTNKNYTSDEIIKLIEEKNNKIKHWKNYDSLKTTKNMTDISKENNFYLGLFIYKEDESGGYPWIRELIQENSGQVIKTRTKKTRIPKQLKEDVWEEFIGNHNEALCYCCRKNKIKNTSYHCGHIIPEKDGGELEIENLRPICQECNSKMATENMRDYIEREYPKNLTLFDNKIKPLIKKENIFIKTMDL